MASGLVANVEIKDEKNQKDYYDKANHYDTLWGLDNIHLGYYPDIEDPAREVPLNFQQAGSALTRKMIALGQINQNSVVLDLGCGKGIACKEIAELTGATCVGIDLAENNIIRANQLAKERGDLKLRFETASYTELPKSILDTHFTHVFSQVAFCHVHKQLGLILSEMKKVMAKSGAVAIINDYIGSDTTIHPDTREHVHKRLHFEFLHGHVGWRRCVEESGLNIETYLNIDKHMLRSYKDLAHEASKYSFKSADGELVQTNYEQTVKALERHDTGMNLAVLTMRAASKL